MGHDKVVGAGHEACKLGFGVGTKEVRTRLGDENVVLATGNRFLDKEELVARLHNDGVAVFHT